MSLSLGRSAGGESIYWVYLNLLLLVAVWPPVACYYLTFYFKLTFCVTEHRRDKQLSLQQHCQAVGVMPSMGLIFVTKTDEWVVFLLAFLGPIQKITFWKCHKLLNGICLTTFTDMDPFHSQYLLFWVTLQAKLWSSALGSSAAEH